MNDYNINKPDCPFLDYNPPQKLLERYIDINSIEAQPEEDRSMILWIIAMAEKLDRMEIWKQIPGYRFAAYGNLHPSFETNAFGVIVYANPMPGFEDQKQYLEISQWSFPIRVRRPVTVPHSPPNIHPCGGTAGCWAESLKQGLPFKQGFLTAKHVFPQGTKSGDSVPLSTGYGKVIDMGPDGIDAALVAPPNPSQCNPGSGIITTRYPVPYTLVSFNGQTSGKVYAMVTAVNDLRGVTYTSNIPLRIFMSCTGNFGDSGAAVFDSQGRGIGLYAGALMDPSGLVEGWAQHLDQVAGVMNLELYE